MKPHNCPINSHREKLISGEEKKTHMLISWTATPRQTHRLLSNHCSIQCLNCFLSILSVTERAEGIKT
jgi:hypothetical protein